MLPDDRTLAELAARLTLVEKVSLLTGRDYWSTVALPRIGLRSMVLSDGPSGVRGPIWDERDPSLSLPSGTALAASWDEDLAARYGAMAAGEARRKGVDIVLGPTVNMQRSPYGGRNFEAFSEDPLLAGILAAAYVRGMQRHGVAATPKHYVANDSESERFTVDVRVDERTLRELYLRPFEDAVVDGGAWALMSAYNSVNGVTVSENDLLETPLNAEWGFDGVVVSDWTGVRSLAAAAAAQDLAMPGPESPWGPALVRAVEVGQVPEAVIDRKVIRMLRLATRVGALGEASRPSASVDGGRNFARLAAVEGMVLLRNDDGLLPLAAPRSIAVVGQNAAVARLQGGGSATVVPAVTVSPLEGVREAFPQSDVRYALGAVVQQGLADIPLAELQHPESGAPGVRVRVFGAEGDLVLEQLRRATSLTWVGGDPRIADGRRLEISTIWTPAETASVELGFRGVGRGCITLDGTAVLDEVAVADGDDLGAAILSPSTCSTVVDVVGGVSYELHYSYDYVRLPGFESSLATGIGIGPDRTSPELLLHDAEELAATSDIVVAVVGTNEVVESEGHDRDSLLLPGLQEELLRRVIRANPRTVVVVNAGAPVVLDAARGAAAVLVGWFGGQEFGAALGDVLSGRAEPGGRLPTTWPRREGDVPVYDVTPSEGRLVYGEGLHIGHRAWLRCRKEPFAWFGAGLGYACWDVSRPAVTVTDDDIVVRADVRNVSGRSGKYVAQVYASWPASVVDRPVRQLVGFTALRVAAGGTRTVETIVPRRALAYWDHGWRQEGGVVELTLAENAGDPGMTVRVELDPSRAIDRVDSAR